MERPIILKAHEVRGILDGRQTQLRRVIKPQPVGKEVFQRLNRLGRKVWTSGYNGNEGLRVAFGGFDCPFGQVGDRLWVRETWGVGTRPDPFVGYRDGIEYKADLCGDVLPLHEIDEDLSEFFGKNGWKPSTSMPRWASRVLLEIVSVRVERLQDISEEDCRANGLLGDLGLMTCKHDDLVIKPTFAVLWDEVNGKGSWNANPFLWVVEFKRVEA